MAWSEDLSPFFADYAVDATVGAVTIQVIPDLGHVDLLGQFGGGIDGLSPVAVAKTSDVTAQSIAQGVAVTIDGVTWYVTRLQPDVSGLLTALVLSREDV